MNSTSLKNKTIHYRSVALKINECHLFDVQPHFQDPLPPHALGDVEGIADPEDVVLLGGPSRLQLAILGQKAVQENLVGAANALKTLMRSPNSTSVR